MVRTNDDGQMSLKVLLEESKTFQCSRGFGNGSGSDL
jgi:hypothetical protein